MEQRYTALAEEQGRLAAEKERLTSENERLSEVSRMPRCALPACRRTPKNRTATSATLRCLTHTET